MAKNSIIDVKEILNSYTNDISEAISEIILETAEEGRQMLRNNKSTYHVRTGKYNKGWKVKKTVGNSFTHAKIYNSTSGQLTHLLENGHATRNGKRTKAFPHIAPVEEYVIDKVTKNIEKTIKQGGK